MFAVLLVKLDDLDDFDDDVKIPLLKPFWFEEEEDRELGRFENDKAFVVFFCGIDFDGAEDDAKNKAALDDDDDDSARMT